MDRVYMITEPEMQGLMDQLHLAHMLSNNHIMHGGPPAFEKLTPDERNRLETVHRAFHHVCVRWAQDMGFKGARS